MSKALAIFGIEGSTFDELYNFCEKICHSDFVPKAKRDKAIDCLLSMQYAVDVGLPAMFGLREIHVVNGKPSLSGDLLLALAENSPYFEYCNEKIEGTDEDMVATCVIKRKNHEPHTCIYTVEDAKKAKLWNKKVNVKNGGTYDTPWVTHPKRMMRYRALGFAVRDKFSDAICGLVSTEEAQDYPTPQPMQNVTPKAAVLEPKAIDETPVERVELSVKLWEKAIHSAVEKPENIDAVIEKMQEKYILSHDQVNDLRNTALDQQAVKEENEVAF